MLPWKPIVIEMVCTQPLQAETQQWRVVLCLDNTD